MGMETAWNSGFRSLWMESDSLVVVRLINGGCAPTLPHYTLVSRIRRFCGMDWELIVSHTRREGNRAVDSMANRALRCDPHLDVLENPLT